MVVIFILDDNVADDGDDDIDPSKHLRSIKVAFVHYRDDLISAFVLAQAFFF